MEEQHLPVKAQGRPMLVAGAESHIACHLGRNSSDVRALLYVSLKWGCSRLLELTWWGHEHDE